MLRAEEVLERARSKDFEMLLGRSAALRPNQKASLGHQANRELSWLSRTLGYDATAG